MTAEQYIVFALIGATFGMFAWGRWRYDVVAATALFVLAVAHFVLQRATGTSNLLKNPESALEGFGHPAVMTVAAVLIISRAMRNSGVVDYISRQVMPLARNQTLHILSLCVVVAVLSAFMNNVGALALMLPVALKTARENNRSPGILLMPLAFASILGGMVTMIGTPPNIIISSLRADLVEGAAPFSLFEYAPVGGLVALGGVAFVVFLGWRLIPREGLKKPGTDELFAINEYITEVRAAEDCKFIGQTIAEVEEHVGDRMTIFGFIRKDGKVVTPNSDSIVQVNNTYLVKADPVELRAVLDECNLRLTKEMRKRIDELKAEDTAYVEVVVPANSPLEGRDRAYLRRRTSNSLVLMAIARQGKPIRKRLGKARFKVGDVLLLQGREEHLEEHISRLNLLLLQRREVQVGIFSRVGASLLIFGGAIALGMLGWMPTVLAFWGAVIIYLFSGILPMRDLYREIDWPIIVLLAAMIPVSKSLQDTGCTELVATTLTSLSGGMPGWLLVGLIMIITMCLSDVINNAATALIMAPISVGIALKNGYNADPFLMSVAVGASCAFLTPIGHQCNALVLGPGGYKFGDYWRMGLPLEILIVIAGTPLIIHFWPLLPLAV